MGSRQKVVNKSIKKRKISSSWQKGSYINHSRKKTRFIKRFSHLPLLQAAAVQELSAAIRIPNLHAWQSDKVIDMNDQINQLTFLREMVSIRVSFNEPTRSEQTN
jgi:hypothetical protein